MAAYNECTELRGEIKRKGRQENEREKQWCEYWGLTGLRGRANRNLGRKKTDRPGCQADNLTPVVLTGTWVLPAEWQSDGPQHDMLLFWYLFGECPPPTMRGTSDLIHFRNKGHRSLQIRAKPKPPKASAHHTPEAVTSARWSTQGSRVKTAGPEIQSGSPPARYVP